jgi:hypothetical protein
MLVDRPGGWTVALGAVMSLDGYIGMDDNTPGSLFDWYFNGDVEVQLRHRRWAHALSAMLSSENAGHGRAKPPKSCAVFGPLCGFTGGPFVSVGVCFRRPA